MSEDLSRVRDELVDIHQFIAEWMSGACPQDDAAFEARLVSRLAKDMTLIMNGRTLDLESATSPIRASHGANPEYRLQVRKVTVRRRSGDILVVTYEVWEREAPESMPPGKASIATAVMKERSGSFEFLHLHETLLPAEVIAADPFDF